MTGIRALPARRLSVLLLIAVGTLGAVPASSFAEEPGGALMSWGENKASELGAGWRDNWEETPTSVVGGLTNVTQVATGSHISLALLADHTVKGWGEDEFYGLGNPSREEARTPIAVPGLKGVSAISAAGFHAMALLENSHVMIWGSNEFGERGNGVLNPKHENPNTHKIEYTMEGSGASEAVEVPGVSGVVEIASGGGTNFALLKSGKVLAWGRNNAGQLGIGTTGPEECNTETGVVACSTEPRPVMVENPTTKTLEELSGVKTLSAGEYSTYALMKPRRTTRGRRSQAGTVMAWGSNGHGELGDGNTTNTSLPVAVTVAGGKELTGVVELSAGSQLALVRRESGEVFAWGGNTDGNLGLSTEIGAGKSEACIAKTPCSKVAKAVPGLEGLTITSVSGGSGFNLVLTESGTVYAFGDNKWGRLGKSASIESSSTPTAVGGLEPVNIVKAGEQASIAVLRSKTPPPSLVSLTPEAKALKLSWNNAASQYKLFLAPFVEEGAKEWGSMIKLGSTARSYTFTSWRERPLEEKPYEIQMKSLVGGVATVRWLVGTPLP